MSLRFHILAPCAVAVLLSLAAASALAAHARFAPTETSEVAGAATTAATSAVAAATPTATAMPGEASATASVNGGGQRLLPVPKEAAPSTRARGLAGPGSLLQREPTPQPHRPTIVIDPGHGRGDPGAVHHLPDGEVDLTEAEANLDIADNLQRFLGDMGYDVYVTRAGFGKPLASGPIPRSLITDDLFDRVRLADSVDGDLFVSIHNNGSTNPDQSGTEVWYCGENAFGADSARLADLMLDAVVQGLKDYGYDTLRRGTQEDSTVHQSAGFCQFLVTREVKMPAVLTESLFLTNDADAAVLKDGGARKAVADRMAQAIDVFLSERQPAP